MKHIIKNISNFVKNDKLIFSLVILCALVSSILSCFFYHLYNNYKEKLLSNNDLLKYISIGIVYTDEDYITKEDLENCIKDFSDNLTKDIINYEVLCEIDKDFLIDCDFNYDGEEYSIFEQKVTNLKNNGMIKIYYTKKQMKEGERVALIYDKGKWDNETPILDRIMKDENTVLIQGKEYKIIGNQDWDIDNVLIPFSSLDGNTKINNYGILIFFDKSITRAQYEELCNVLIDNFGQKIKLPLLEIPEPGTTALYRTIIGIAIMISLIASLNFILLYKYILTRRKKDLAIYRMCGLNKYKATIMYLIECIVIVVPTFIIGIIIYNYGIFPQFKEYFYYVDSSYNKQAYALIFIVYLIISTMSLLILIISEMSNKTIVRMEKG